MKDRNRGREVERKEFVGDVFLTLMLSYREKKLNCGGVLRLRVHVKRL